MSSSAWVSESASTPVDLVGTCWTAALPRPARAGKTELAVHSCQVAGQNFHVRQWVFSADCAAPAQASLYNSTEQSRRGSRARALANGASVAVILCTAVRWGGGKDCCSALGSRRGCPGCAARQHADAAGRPCWRPACPPQRCIRCRAAGQPAHAGRACGRRCVRRCT